MYKRQVWRTPRRYDGPRPGHGPRPRSSGEEHFSPKEGVAGSNPAGGTASATTLVTPAAEARTTLRTRLIEIRTFFCSLFTVTWTADDLFQVLDELRARHGDTASVEVKRAAGGLPDLAETLCSR